ncbi:hypothetical protein [Paraliomyxa miuraensis]|uniref:hypothetical protein n=1 Tax=Paraliomyxa miuraensis TaxID=376150 RepID=UPI0022519AC9|nr:hypothetical protein [Paraliomyxa miuraensis]MCX4242232.1 hypothetical protein [Paraliomyxa miuraensis]
MVGTVRLALGVVVGSLLLAGCFDSDEKYVPAAGSSSTTGPITTTGVDSSTTSAESSTTEAPDKTCRDAIECVVGCAGALQTSMLPEPDFTCFLECEEGLNTAEVLHLFRLTECVTNECIADGNCDFLVPTETTGDEPGGSSSSGTDGTRPPICLNCVLGGLLDDNPGGECGGFAAECI